jgi:hypothetical protein
MNMRRLPFVMLLSVSALAVACGDPQPAENPPQPTSTPTAEPAPTAVETAAPTATAAATAAPTATAVVEAPPPPKPAKERIVGTWTFSFEGEIKAKKEEELKKKLGAKEKDAAKLDAKVAEEIKKIADEAAGEWVEFKDGYYVSHVTEKGKDKVVLKVKYAIVKDDTGSVTMKADGKPDVGKMDPKMEVTVTLKDDNTLEMPDPKKGTLVFKRKP